MRLYSPESFGVFAVFISLASTLAAAVTGKYEVAMMLPRRHPVARQLFAVSVWFGLITTAVFLLALFPLAEGLLDWLGTPELAGWVFAVPMVALLTGMFTLGGHSANRFSNYWLMAKSKVFQSIVVVSVSIVLGVAGLGFEGLVLGHALGLFFATLYLFVMQTSVLPRDIFRGFKKKVRTAFRYYDYPIYFGTTAVIGGITLSMPVFFFTHSYPSEVVGHYALVMRVVFTPLSFLSAAIFQVNMKQVVDLANADQTLVSYIWKVALWLLAASVVPVMILVLWAPQLFSIVFGDKWFVAGQYAQILAITLPFRFVASTLSSTLGATRNNEYSALWKIVAFCSTFVVLMYGIRQDTFWDALVALVIVEVVLYISYFLLILRSASRPKNLVVG